MLRSLIACLHWSSLAFVAGAHMQEVWPLLAPMSLVVFATLNAKHFRIPRPLPWALIATASLIAYIIALLAIHNVLRDYTFVDAIQKHARLVYVLGIAGFFALFDEGAQLTRRMISAFLAVIGAICFASLYSRYVGQITVGDIRMSDQYGTPLGLLNNHNALAGMAGSGIILALTAWMAQSRRRNSRLIGGVSFLAVAVIAITFLHAFSRSYSFALAATMVAMAMQIPDRGLRRTSVVAVLFIGAFTVAIALANRNNDLRAHSVSSRFSLARTAASQWMKSPFFGIGPGSFEEWQVTYQEIVPHVLTLRKSGKPVNAVTYAQSVLFGGAHAHNSYLQMLCDVGVFGFVLYAWIFFSAFRRFDFVDAETESFSIVSPAGTEIAEAEFFRDLTRYMLLFVCAASIFSGYAFSSPPLTLILYMGLARMIVHTEAASRVLETELAADLVELTPGPARLMATRLTS